MSQSLPPSSSTSSQQGLKRSSQDLFNSSTFGLRSSRPESAPAPPAAAPDIEIPPNSNQHDELIQQNSPPRRRQRNEAPAPAPPADIVQDSENEHSSDDAIMVNDSSDDPPPARSPARPPVRNFELPDISPSSPFPHGLIQPHNMPNFQAEPQIPLNIEPNSGSGPPAVPPAPASPVSSPPRPAIILPPPVILPPPPNPSSSRSGSSNDIISSSSLSSGPSSPASALNSKAPMAPPIIPPQIPQRPPGTPPFTRDGEAESCNICFEQLANSGVHQISCVPCGHVFGKSCIEKWFNTTAVKACPMCKFPFKKKDIRTLFLERYCVMDKSKEVGYEHEIERLKKENKDLKQRNGDLVHKLAMTETQVKKLNAASASSASSSSSSSFAAASSLSTSFASGPRWMTQFKQPPSTSFSSASLQSRLSSFSASSSSFSAPSRAPFHPSSSFNLSSTTSYNFTLFNDTRVLDFSRPNLCLLLSSEPRASFSSSSSASSSSSPNPIIQIQKISAIDPENSRELIQTNHTSLIRDIHSHPSAAQQEYVLSASMDKTVKISSVKTNRIVQTYQTQSLAAWSCHWLPSLDPNLFAAGLQNSIVKVYDIRKSGADAAAVHTFSNSVAMNSGHVHSIRYISASEGGSRNRIQGLLIASITGVFFLERKEGAAGSDNWPCHTLPLQGVCLSLDAAPDGSICVATFRKCKQFPEAQGGLHIRFQLTRASEDGPITAEVIKVMDGFDNRLTMSKSCILPPFVGDAGAVGLFPSFVASGDDASSRVLLWDAAASSSSSSPTSKSILSLDSSHAPNKVLDVRGCGLEHTSDGDAMLLASVSSNKLILNRINVTRNAASSGSSSSSSSSSSIAI